MSIQIPTHHVEQYNANVVMLAQQKGSVLRNTVRMDGSVVGKAVYFDRIGATAMQEKTGRHDDTPLVDTPHSRRKANLRDFVWADLIDNEDQIKTIYDPTSPYARNAGWAAGRTVDDRIIEAFNASALEGVAGGTSTALPAAQQIAVGATGLTLAKLRSARKILKQGEIDMSQQLYIAVNAEAMDDLLGDSTVTSADFNSVKALVDGEIDTFMGFKFISTERLPLNTAGDRLCFAWGENGMGLEIGSDIKTVINERADKNNATQVHVSVSVTAVRIEDAQVVEIAIAE